MDTRTLDSCVICGRPLAEPRIQRRTCDHAACRFAYQQHLRTRRATCTECGRPLSPIEESRGARACQDPRCQVHSLLNQGIAVAERCRACGIRLSPDCVSDGVCRDFDCRAVDAWRQQLEQAKARLEQYLEQTRQATLLRDRRGAAAGVASPEDYFVTVVSWLPNRLVALPAARRDAFRERVELLVNELAASSDADLEPVEVPSSQSVENTPTVISLESEKLSGEVCAACRGFCCRRGDTHAYLQVDTLRRLLRQQREVHVEQLADLYVDQLPEQSFSDSCVFHSETGCALPRVMRSDTCNNYFCTGQQNLRAALERGTPPQAFVAISDGTEIVVGRFLNATGEDLSSVFVRTPGPVRAVNPLES